jgi:hypothetical protein
MREDAQGKHLTGTYRVRAIRPAFDDVHRLCRRVRDKMEIRKHSLKLRFWPNVQSEDEAGKLLDLDWSWVKSLPGLKIGELRIDDVIGGNDNLRIIFFQGPTSVKEPLPMLWVLRVMQKTRMDFSKHDLTVFRARRLLVLERFYHNPLA